MAFERGYRFCWGEGVTECTLTAETGGAIIIAPNVSGDECNSTYFSMIHGDQTIHSTLSRPALDQLIAELQRARNGCFYGEWPRPFVEDAVLFDQDAEDDVDEMPYCGACGGPCQWPDEDDGAALLDEFTSAWASQDNECELCAPDDCDLCEVCVPPAAAPDPELERLLAEEEEIERAARLGRFVARTLSDDDRKAIIDGLFDRLFGELV